MSTPNQAHVEALCSAKYLDHYLDCMDNLPDELQRILTQIREVDVKLRELETESTPLNEIFFNVCGTEGISTKDIAHVQTILIKMQEFEDEKIQLSALLMEYIETRMRQLDVDRENLDPDNHVVNEPPPKPSVVSISSKREHNASVIESDRDTPKQSETKTPASISKKRKPSRPEPVVTPKAATKVPAPTPAPPAEEETPVKKPTTPEDAGASKSSSKINSSKRKRQSRAKSKDDKKEPSEEPEEPTYCLCNQISYGEMIGCDNDACPIEWFHFNCVNLTTKPPKGKWYCPKCRGDKSTVMKKMDRK